jgi:tRNA U38,U39,U40 pseudouridine synthase TruA
MVEDYLKSDPPIKDQDGNGTFLKMRVRVSSITHFNEMDMTFTARFSIQLKWYDWRVTFYNLKDSKENFNHIGLSDLQTLWLPRLIFSNCIYEASLKYDDLSSMICQRKGPSTLSSPDEIEENESFEGDSNPMVYNRTYELELECNFHLEKYPFDYQSCFIDVSKSI